MCRCAGTIEAEGPLRAWERALTCRLATSPSRATSPRSTLLAGLLSAGEPTVSLKILDPSFVKPWMVSAHTASPAVCLEFALVHTLFLWPASLREAALMLCKALKAERFLACSVPSFQIALVNALCMGMRPWAAECICEMRRLLDF